MITSGLPSAVPPDGPLDGSIDGSPDPGDDPGRPGPTPWSAWVDRSTAAVSESGRWRRPKTFDAAGPTGHLVDPSGGASPRPVVSFASNDYLGLATHPAVVGAAHAALDRWGAGSGASRLVTGSRPVHAELEGALASWKGCERAVVFPTGFAANLSVLSVFGAEGAHIFSDELNHASIVDGCRLARAPVTVFPHAGLGRLDRQLATTTGRPVIVSDTVFSMDGDEADVAGLVAVARRHDALLVLDEAHAVLGPDLPERRSDVLRVGTLSKSLGSLGGFVAGPARYTEYLVNRARPYIFTTASTPADAAAALAAIGVVRSAEGAGRRARLAGLVARVAAAVGRAGHPSPILPVVVGAEADAVAASDRLLAGGVWVPAIRPPTVAPGTSRLRITVSAIHRDEEVDRLISGLVAAGLAGGGRGAGAP